MDRRPFPYPVVIPLMIALCALVQLAMLGQSMINGEAWAGFWIYFNPQRVYEGRYWTLLTAAFVHVHLLHLAFCMFLLWALGARLELVFGRQAVFAFIFFGAILTAGAQFALISWSGMGMLPVVFGLYGWMLPLRRRVPLFRHFLAPRMIAFLTVSLIVGLLLGLVRAWPASHLACGAGLLFGLAVSQMFSTHRLRRWAALGVPALLALLTLAGLLQAPWNHDWLVWSHLRAAEGRMDEPTRRGLADRLLASRDPERLNRLAWTLATDPQPALRDGRLALELARRACELTDWREPNLTDTLAAAHAELGQWDEAERVQRQAVELARELGSTMAIFRLNLEKIQRREKIRD